MNVRLQYSELHKLPSQWAPPSETPTQARLLTVTPSVQPGAVGAEETKEQIIVPPTIALTATPGLLSEAIEQVVGSITGEEELILGWTSEDWVNLLISSLIVVLAGRAIRGFLIIIGLIGMMDRLGFNITALLAVLGIGGLALYAKKDHPQPNICDLEGPLRLIFKPVSFDELLSTAFDMLCHAGSDDATVLLKMLDAFEKIGRKTQDAGRPRELQSHVSLVQAESEAANLISADKLIIRQRCEA